jgi:biotin carboxylase
MENYSGKKLLVLGGLTLEIEIVTRAQEMGLYVIVADYNPEVPARKYADQFELISATDVPALVDFCRKEKVDGVTTGFIDILMKPCYDVCKELGLPCYFTPKMIEVSTNKIAFKEECNRYGVPVPQTYLVGGEITDEVYSKISYPVFVKPLDSSGSRGAGVCRNREELDLQFAEALSYSGSGNAIIEDYITGRDFLLDYMAVNGEYRLLSMFDRYMAPDRGSAVNMSNIAIAPSRNIDFYLENINEKVTHMYRELGFSDGLLFMQGYCDGNKVTFFEMGCRLGGSYFNHQRHLFGDDAIRMIIRYAMTGKMVSDISQFPVDMAKYNGRYAADINFLLKGKEGKVGKIVGIDKIKERPSCVETLLYADEGYEWTEARIVDRAIFTAEITAENKDQLVTEAGVVQALFDAFDENGNSILMEKLDPQDLYKA